MSRHAALRLSAVVALALLPSACMYKRVAEEPIIEQGDRVSSYDEAVERARRETERRQAAERGRRDSIAAEALADCRGDRCAYVARGEVALGMTRDQVLAATRTTERAWSLREAGDATVLAPPGPALPRDAQGLIAFVQLRRDRVTSIAYREPQGVRLVQSPADSTADGRAAQLADALVREGDGYAAAGDLRLALDRYDRASILRPDDASVDYRIATTLDKQLRPMEAIIRYRLFLHKLEIERIQATGDANARLADAIARAQQRVTILERQVASPAAAPAPAPVQVQVQVQQPVTVPGQPQHAPTHVAPSTPPAAVPAPAQPAPAPESTPPVP